MLIADRTPRVGDRLALVKKTTGGAEPEQSELVDVATVVRKELQCERYLVRMEDGELTMLFVCPRTKTWWVMELDESEATDAEE